MSEWEAWVKSLKIVLNQDHLVVADMLGNSDYAQQLPVNIVHLGVCVRVRLNHIWEITIPTFVVNISFFKEV